MAELTMIQKIEAQMEAEKKKNEDKMAKYHDQLAKAEGNYEASIAKLVERQEKTVAQIAKKEESLELSIATLAKIEDQLVVAREELSEIQGNSDDQEVEDGGFA